MALNTSKRNHVTPLPFKGLSGNASLIATFFSCGCIIKVGKQYYGLLRDTVITFRFRFVLTRYV